MGVSKYGSVVRQSLSSCFSFGNTFGAVVNKMPSGHFQEFWLPSSLDVTFLNEISHAKPLTEDGERFSELPPGNQIFNYECRLMEVAPHSRLVCSVKPGGVDSGKNHTFEQEQTVLLAPPLQFPDTAGVWNNMVVYGTDLNSRDRL
ncbi:hypothetical protein AVEN_165579-1 [Araneus ventricosus]|uniref:Uncharacterized protein n=1 Tax=Araneus ventricosus TaxID=182803 RepID=A0A4Y2EQ61_ARAVE|nr:hypothetical protein AVEN_165579-1 [Araneus ventricosus]